MKNVLFNKALIVSSFVSHCLACADLKLCVCYPSISEASCQVARSKNTSDRNRSVYTLCLRHMLVFMIRISGVGVNFVIPSLFGLC